MKDFRHVILISICFLGCYSAGELQAQDPQFVQFYSSPMFVNPALVGSNQNIRGRVNLQHRNQWPSLPGSFVTSLLNAEFRLNEKGTGIGLLGSRDEGAEGTFVLTNVGIMTSQYFKITDKIGIRLGTSLERITAKVDFSRIRCEDCFAESSFRGMIRQNALPIEKTKVGT